MKAILTLFFCLLSFLESPIISKISDVASQQKAVESFQIMDGFEIELVVAEPLIRDPVAMEIDEDGNWFVVEMPGYPLDLSKTGVVKKLKDTDGDGMPDKSIIFASELTLPTGIMKWKNGVIVTDPPNVLYLEDTNGDDIADKKEIILTGFSLSNPQHNMNTPKFGVDNWIYLGHSGAINSFAYENVFSDKGSEIRFANNPEAKKISKNADGKNVRFKPETYEIETLSGETQFGHTTDNWGHRFNTDNANHLFHEVIDARYIAQNAHLALADAMMKIPDHGDACEVFPITENPNHQLLTDVGVVTSSCGITYYNGGNFGEYFNNVTFVGEPVHNLVHADKIIQNGSSFIGKRLIEKTEFLASNDPWFRPVNFYIGPDGAMYLVDYYRQIVEHPEWMSEEINNSGALYNGTDKGRIYRISKKGSGKMRWFGNTKLSQNSPAKLVELLKSTNGWVRRTAQRLLFQKNDTSISENLIKIISENNAEAKIPALWLLYDWQKIDPEVLTMALKDLHPGVRENALQIADRLLEKDKFQSNNNLRQQLLSLSTDSDPRVRFQWLCSSSFFKYSETNDLRSSLLIHDIQDPWIGVAAIASSSGSEIKLFDEVISKFSHLKDSNVDSFLANLSATVGKSGDNTLFIKALESNAPWQSSVYLGLADLWKYSTKTFTPTETDLVNLTKIFTESKSIDVRKSITELLTVTGLPNNQTYLKKSYALLNNPGYIHSQENILKLLSLSNQKTYTDKIINLAVEAKNKSIQKAALASLPKNISLVEITKINQVYKILDHDSKRIWIKYLLSKKSRIPILLSQIDLKQIPQNDLEWPEKVHLMNYYDTNIRAKAREVLSINEDRKAVLQNYLVAADMKGIAENGKKIFQENCASCHKIKGVNGADFGPDLSTIRSRNSYSIITEIINPNNSIADKYASWDIELKTGTILTGIIIAENSKTIFLKMMGGKTQTFNTEEIKSKSIAKLSAMPNGLENAINVQGMADLVAFIKNI